MDIDKLFPWGTLGLVLFIMTMIRNAFYVDRIEKERKQREAIAKQNIDELEEKKANFIKMTFDTSEEAYFAREKLIEKRAQQHGKRRWQVNDFAIEGSRETGYRIVDRASK